MFKNILSLTRLNNPIPIVIFFYPSLWGILTARHNINASQLAYYIIIFFLGSVFMRSAGCVINDIIDRDIDKYVKRTENRPIASGKISVPTAFLIFFLLCLLGILILIRLNKFAIFIASIGGLMMIVYPFTKRIMKRPQLFLGITFQIGLLVAHAEIVHKITISSLLMYIGAIYWTVNYDTVYAFQDIVYDKKMNLNSTAIVYQSNPRRYLIGLLIMMHVCLIASGIVNKNEIGGIYYILIILNFGLMIKMTNSLDVNNSISCSEYFQQNVIIGAILSFAMIFGG